MPVKELDMQVATHAHLSQPTGAGAFDGQHGMSLAISSIVSDEDISSVIAGIEACADASAMTGREAGASARPAIIKTASSRRMAELRFTKSGSHKLEAMESIGFYITLILPGPH